MKETYPTLEMTIQNRQIHSDLPRVNDVGLIPGKLPRLQLSGQQVKEEETGYELAETKASY